MPPALLRVARSHTKPVAECARGCFWFWFCFLQSFSLSYETELTLQKSLVDGKLICVFTFFRNAFYLDDIP